MRWDSQVKHARIRDTSTTRHANHAQSVQAATSLTLFCGGGHVHFAGVAADVSQAKIAITSRLSLMCGILRDELNAQLQAEAARITADAENMMQRLRQQPADPPELVTLCAYIEEASAAADGRRAVMAAAHATYNKLAEARVAFADEAVAAFWQAVACGPKLEVCRMRPSTLKCQSIRLHFVRSYSCGAQMCSVKWSD